MLCMKICLSAFFFFFSWHIFWIFKKKSSKFLSNFERLCKIFDSFEKLVQKSDDWKQGKMKMYKEETYWLDGKIEVTLSLSFADGNLFNKSIPIFGPDCPAKIWLHFPKEAIGRLLKFRQKEALMFCCKSHHATHLIGSLFKLKTSTEAKATTFW